MNRHQSRTVSNYCSHQWMTCPLVFSLFDKVKLSFMGEGWVWVSYVMTPTVLCNHVYAADSDPQDLDNSVIIEL